MKSSPPSRGKSRSFSSQPSGVDAASFYRRLEEEEEGGEETTFHLQKATASGHHHHPAEPRKGVGAFIRGTGRD